MKISSWSDLKVVEILKAIFESQSFHWWRVNGLLLGLACTLTIAIAIHPVLGNEFATIGLFLFLSTTWGGVWAFKNRLRKIQKNKIGVVLCIHSKEPEVDERVREDFVLSLKKSLEKNDENNIADVLVVPYHIASSDHQPGLYYHGHSKESGGRSTEVIPLWIPDYIPLEPRWRL